MHVSGDPDQVVYRIPVAEVTRVLGRLGSGWHARDDILTEVAKRSPHAVRPDYLGQILYELGCWSQTKGGRPGRHVNLERSRRIWHRLPWDEATGAEMSSDTVSSTS